MRIRYDGVVPITMMTAGTRLEPGDEFTVPDEVGESYLSRGDMTLVVETKSEVEPRAATAVTKAKAVVEATENIGDQGTGTETETV